MQAPFTHVVTLTSLMYTYAYHSHLQIPFRSHRRHIDTHTHTFSCEIYPYVSDCIMPLPYRPLNLIVYLLNPFGSINRSNIFYYDIYNCHAANDKICMFELEILLCKPIMPSIIKYIYLNLNRVWWLFCFSNLGFVLQLHFWLICVCITVT